MKAHPFKLNALTAAVALCLLPAAPSFANPEGGNVVAGQASIQQQSPTQLGITQSTDKAIIEWSRFNIGVGEQTRFYQPSAASIALNRVTGEDPSQILGRLTANGQIFLVNPNGIYFGPNAQVDVAGLVASTHNISNENFLAGRYVFDQPGKPGASVINAGSIRVSDTGIAAFVAPSVANQGIIAAKLGKIALAAANGFTLDFYGDQLLSFLVKDEVAQTALDPEGRPLKSFTENAGRIEAQGGYVLLTAKAAESAVQGVINQTGVIEASTVGQQAGRIILDGGEHGVVSVGGLLDASAPNDGNGGFIETSGEKVRIQDGLKPTTHAAQGITGTWLIDPTDYTIAASGGDITGSQLSGYLTATNVEVKTLANGNGNGDIFVNDSVNWGSVNNSLTLTAHRNINVNETIRSAGFGGINLRADAESTGIGTVNFAGNGHLYVSSGGARIDYNPASYTDGATKSDAGGNPYSSNVTGMAGGIPTLGFGLTARMLVNNLAQLQAMDSNLTGNYVLGKDIDASATRSWNNGAGFAPVGSSATPANPNVSPFKGSFNGLGHSISGLTINRPTEDYIGLFGTVGDFGLSNSSGEVRDIRLVNGTVTGNTSVGGLVGANNGFIYQAEVDDYVILGGTDGNTLGGLAGQNSGTILKSHATSYVLGQQGIPDHGVIVGGLVGDNLFGGNIKLSYSTGLVTGTNVVGGLVGRNSGTISQSYATSQVSGDSYIGGLVGENRPLINHTALINETYSTGLVVGGSSNVGGLAGSNNSLINNSYWDIQSSGQATSNGQASGAGGTGLSTLLMQQRSSYPNTWDFTSTWQITEGVSYPTFNASISSTPATVLTPNEPSAEPKPVQPVEVPVPAVQPDSVSLERATEEFTLANTTLNLTKEQIGSVTNYISQYSQNNHLSIAYANTEESNELKIGYLEDTDETKIVLSKKTTTEIKGQSYSSAEDLFERILKKELQADPKNKQWNSMYIDGKATDAQKDAVKMLKLYDTYSAANAEILADALLDHILTYNDTVWKAIAAKNSNAEAASDRWIASKAKMAKYLKGDTSEPATNSSSEYMSFEDFKNDPEVKLYIQEIGNGISIYDAYSIYKDESKVTSLKTKIANNAEKIKNTSSLISSLESKIKPSKKFLSTLNKISEKATVKLQFSSLAKQENSYQYKSAKIKLDQLTSVKNTYVKKLSSLESNLTVLKSNNLTINTKVSAIEKNLSRIGKALILYDIAVQSDSLLSDQTNGVEKINSSLSLGLDATLLLKGASLAKGVLSGPAIAIMAPVQTALLISEFEEDAIDAARKNRETTLDSYNVAYYKNQLIGDIMSIPSIALKAQMEGYATEAKTENGTEYYEPFDVAVNNVLGDIDSGSYRQRYSEVLMGLSKDVDPAIEQAKKDVSDLSLLSWDIFAYNARKQELESHVSALEVMKATINQEKENLEKMPELFDIDLYKVLQDGIINASNITEFGNTQPLQY